MGVELGDSGPYLELGWKDVSFQVPRYFYLDYLDDLREAGIEGYGLVSGVEDALDWLWPNLRAAAAAQGLLTDTMRAKWFRMLRCWHLPTGAFWVYSWSNPSAPSEAEPLGSLFFSSGWSDDAPEESRQAPLEVYFLSMLLVATYSSQIEDDCTGNERCQGFGEWVGWVVRGIPVGSSWNEHSCAVQLPQILFVNTEAGFAGPQRWVADGKESADSWVNTCDVPTDWYWQSCEQDFDAARDLPGRPWDNWQPVWSTTSNTYGSAHPGSYAASWSEDEPTESVGPADYWGNTSSGSWTIRLPPVVLAWDAFIVDHLLFKARLAYDYSRWEDSGLSSGEQHQLQKTARKLARFALARLAFRGDVLIHELGHIYTAANHCSDSPDSNDCCMEFAAGRWRCAVTAMLGLPFDYKDSYAGAGEGATDTKSLAITCDAEPDDLGVSASHRCTVDDYWVVGSTATFCCRGCSWDSGLPDECRDV